MFKVKSINPMKKLIILIRLSICLLLWPIAYGCQSAIVLKDVITPNPETSQFQNDSTPSILNPSTCEYPMIENFSLRSTCNRVNPCSNLIQYLNTSWNEINWRVASYCNLGNNYNTLNGIPYYKLYRYVGMDGNCEKYHEILSFSCNQTQMRASLNLLSNYSKFILGVFNQPIPTIDIYRDPNGILHGNSCNNYSTWGMSDIQEFATDDGKGRPCVVGPGKIVVK
jgi:hypothetical protein